MQLCKQGRSSCNTDISVYHCINSAEVWNCATARAETTGSQTDCHINEAAKIRVKLSLHHFCITSTKFGWCGFKWDPVNNKWRVYLFTALCWTGTLQLRGVEIEMVWPYMNKGDHLAIPKTKMDTIVRLHFWCWLLFWGQIVKGFYYTLH